MTSKKNLVWPDYENCLANLPNSILKYFGDKFLLMPMEEAIEKKLFGTGSPHKNFRSML